MDPNGSQRIASERYPSTSYIGSPQGLGMTTATQCTQRVGLVRGLVESRLGYVVQTAQPHSFNVVAELSKLLSLVFSNIL